MLRNVLIAAMCAFCVVVAGMILVVGGCVGKRHAATEPSKVYCPPPAAQEIGDSSAAIGRLEETATVTATVYHADGWTDSGQPVDVQPGTWLIPSRVFASPAGSGSGGDDEKE